MRSVRVGVVGSAPGRAVGAFFERRANGRLLLTEVIPSSPVAVAGRVCGSRQGWFQTVFGVFGRKRPVPVWVLGLPPSVAVVRRVAMPALPLAQQAKLLAFEARQVIAAQPEDLVWAPAAFPAVPGGSAWIALGVGRREALERMTGDEAAAGRPVDRCEPRCVAMYRNFRYNYPEWWEGVVLIVDLSPEGRGFSVMLADQGSFATRTVGAGAGDKGGTAPAWSWADAPAATALAERIHLEVARLLATYETGRADEPRLTIQRVFLAGERSALTLMTGTLSQRLGLPVERLDPFRRVDVSPGLAFHDDHDRAAEWVGLAAAPSAGCPALDLSPPSTRSERARRIRRPYVRAALLALLLAPLPPGCVAVREAGSELRETDRLRTELARLAPMAADLRLRQEEASRLREDAARWRAVCEARTRWISFLDDLQRRIAVDGNVWLDRLERLPPGAKGDGTSPRLLRLSGGLLETPGGSDDVSAGSRDRIEAVLEALKQSPWIAGSEHERFNLTPDNGLRFDVVFTLAEKPLP